MTIEITMVIIVALLITLAYVIWLDFFKPCKHKVVIKLSSIQKVKCCDCYAMIDWPLKENQPPLVTSSRDKRK